MNELFRVAKDTISDSIRLFNETPDETEWKMACLCLIAMSSHLLGVLEGIMEDKNDSNNNSMHHVPPSGGKTSS